MSIIIGTPLTAACEAQNVLAEASSDYKKNSRFDDFENPLSVEDEVERLCRPCHKFCVNGRD